MLSPKNIIKSFFIASIFTASLTEAVAGMYGFHHYNPYTKEERILDLSTVPNSISNYRAMMRDNMLMLIRYAKEQNPDLKIITHEGQDLLTKSLWEYDREGYNRARKKPKAKDDSFLFHTNYREKEPERYTPEHEYLKLIDAVAINNLYCGKGKESSVTHNHDLGLISIEHCPDKDTLDTARISSMIDRRSLYGFTDINEAFNNTNDHREINDSAKNIFNVSDAQNILILNDDSRYISKDHLMDELLKTNYDIIIMKPLFASSERFSADDLQKLHFKKNGSKRLLIAEFNVSEASPKEYYWHRDWNIKRPSWMVRKSFTNEDNYITQYWHPEWKQIISRHFKDVLGEGFDGIFFTGVENYRYFEQQTPLE